MNTIIYRPFHPSDIKQVIQLFKEAVQAINSKDYTAEQIAVWTAIDEEKWLSTLQRNHAFVAEYNKKIIGFADLTDEGYLDRLYIHKDYQGRFISLKLMKCIEDAARKLGLKKITTHCSITAKRPAEWFGFTVIQEQTVERKGIKLTNYVMEKVLN